MAQPILFFALSEKAKNVFARTKSKQKGMTPLDDSFSDSLSTVLTVLQSAKNTYAAVCDEANRLDSLQQDLLHKLELEPLNAVQMIGVAKQLKECRMERRVVKDQADLLEPVVNFVDTQENKKAISNLQKTLGVVRQRTTNKSNRCYYPMVMSEEEFYGKIKKD